MQTNIGRVLIAVNPFKVLDIYGPDVLECYREDGKIDQLEYEMSSITVPLHRDRVSRCSTAKLPAFKPHSKYVQNLHKSKVDRFGAQYVIVKSRFMCTLNNKELA